MKSTPESERLQRKLQGLTARDAILRELESAEAALKGAQDAYAKDQRDLQAAQRRAESSYEGRARNQRNVDRLKKALAIIEGEEVP